MKLWCPKSVRWTASLLGWTSLRSGRGAVGGPQWTKMLGCHFSRDSFQGLGIFLFFSPSLQNCDEFGGAILFFDVYISGLPSGLRVHNLWSYQPLRLKTCLSWGFARSGCHAPGVP